MVSILPCISSPYSFSTVCTSYERQSVLYTFCNRVTAFTPFPLSRAFQCKGKIRPTHHVPAVNIFIHQHENTLTSLATVPVVHEFCLLSHLQLNIFSPFLTSWTQVRNK
uniref:Uncharacterized protein n=1 Tax=Scleropages formosus TaxID=113540 RepID=A0A8C9SKU7_SCLFO